MAFTPKFLSGLTSTPVERAELLGKLGKSGEAATLLLSTTMPSLKSGKLLENAGRFEEAIQAHVAVAATCFLEVQSRDDAGRPRGRGPRGRLDLESVTFDGAAAVFAQGEGGLLIGLPAALADGQPWFESYDCGTEMPKVK